MINIGGLEIRLTQLTPSAESLTDGTQSEQTSGTDMLDFRQIWGGQDEIRDPVKALVLDASELAWPTPAAAQDIDDEHPADTGESISSGDASIVRRWALNEVVTPPEQNANLPQKGHTDQSQISVTQEGEKPSQEQVISEVQPEDNVYENQKLDTILPKIDKISTFSHSAPNTLGLSGIQLTDRATRSRNTHPGDLSIQGRTIEASLNSIDDGLAQQSGILRPQPVDIPKMTEPPQLGQGRPQTAPIDLGRSPPTGSTPPSHPTGHGGVTATQNQTADTPPSRHHRPQTGQSSSIVTPAPEKGMEYVALQGAQPIDGHGREMRSAKPAPSGNSAATHSLGSTTQPPAVPPLFDQSLALDSANDPISSDPLIAPVQVQSGQPIQQGAPAILPASYAPKVAAQLASAAIQTSAGTTQILLNPEELGRVRMTLTTTDQGIAVSIMAERPETIDLMRRHVDLLIKEFEDIDRGGVEFNFEENGDDSSETESNSSQPEPFTRLENAINPDVILTHIEVPTTGLDLKL